MKFRFCGGLEPPDWVLVEIPLLLSGESRKVLPSDLSAMCHALAVNITREELEQAQSLFEEKDERNAAVAVLRFILTHAAKYDVERTDLVKELLQLGMHLAAAEAIALSYEHHRPRIQDQLRAQRFRFPGIEKVKWNVEADSRVSMHLMLDRPVMECDVATTAASSELSFDMSKAKFLALYEELRQAQSMLRSVQPSTS
uniref:COMM domain-containing protein n=1 Tax=Peronospora matthiolae TaxID=2874970 RepID=A0AAV1TR67_9STRA